MTIQFAVAKPIEVAIEHSTQCPTTICIAIGFTTCNSVMRTEKFITVITSVPVDLNESAEVRH